MRAGLFLAAIVYVLIASPLTLGLRRRAISSNTETNLINVLSNVVTNTSGFGQNTSVSVSAIASQLEQINSTGTATPHSAESALSTIQKLFYNGEPNIVDVAYTITFSGLVSADVLSLLNGYLDSDLNSLHNQNPAPSQNIYPSKAKEDAPYSTPEEKLRAAIHIPDSFSYGQRERPQ